MRENGFVNLHVHTEYSLLDGACRIKKLIGRVKELGQTAVAITDHGNMYGAVEFWREAEKNGIKAIIGCEVYVAPRSRHDKEGKIDLSPFHLILLCENNRGYENLVRLVSLASIEGFYNRPRVDTELLREYHSGLICLSACLYGEIARLLVNGRYGEAKRRSLEYLEIFGRGNYFLEVQNHGLDDELRIIPQLYRLSAETGIPLVATNDCHYINKEDAEMHKVLWCIQTNQPFDDGEKSSGESYIKSADEMAELFRGHTEVLENTVKIAERCNVGFEFGNIRLPKFTADGITDNEKYLYKLCTDGLLEKYGENPPENVKKRLEYEISVITKMGYTDYFLIVWDFVRYAKENKIPVGVGRGSGAGSLCAYCMGITGIDPVKYGLLFERFLNPERVSMPDFDIDFCIEGRQKVKNYVVRKYGSDRVSEIIAFDTLKARQAIRDVGRVLGLPYSLVDKTAKLIDFGATLDESLKNSPELRSMYGTDKAVKRLVDLALKIEGMPRHATTHAAGVVISAVPLSDIVPLQKNDGTIVTQYSMGILESLGLLKMDFLGLRNLTVIRDTVNEIRKNVPDFDINNIPLDDRNVYKMLADGDTQGVFQFESSGITQCLTELKPERIEDLIVMLSLYRPGPMKSIPLYIKNKNNPEKVIYKNEILREILAETHGCIVYQEQVMEICRKLAGYSYGHADIVRRAMAKKKPEVMEKERKIFIDGAEKNGVDRKTAEEIFTEMSGFASYAFNKSHATAYAVLSYQTAYLKYHYRGIYMSALMSSVISYSGKLNEYINSCRADGMEIVRPDINKSSVGFSFTDGKMYFGLLAVKNVGGGSAEKIVEERRKNGDFRGLQDFCERMDSRDINKKSLENLIMSGAFDGLGLNRRQMIENYEAIFSTSGAENFGVIDGQLNFLDGTSSQGMTMKIPDIPEYNRRKLLSMEKEATGIYLSGNPLAEYGYMSALMKTRKIADILVNAREGETVRLLCLIQGKKIHSVRNKPEKMCFLELSDGTGEIDAVVFPDLYAKTAEILGNDRIVLITGKVSVKDDSVSVVCGSVVSEGGFSAMTDKMKLCIITDGMLVNDDLLKICRDFSGSVQVVFYIRNARKTVLPKSRISLDINAESFSRLEKIYNKSDMGLIP